MDNETKKTDAAGEPEKEQPEKNEPKGYKYAAFSLAALVAMLLAFFIGMRLIDTRPQKEYVLTQPVSETGTEAAAETPIDRSIPKININIASKQELTELPGIGDARAAAIIQYRLDNGDYERIEDIKKIPGIGKEIFAGIEDLICVD